MSLFINYTLNGLTQGMIFASLALALVLVFRATKIINFAQGAMAMMTTFIASSLLNKGWGYWWAFGAVLVIGFVFYNTSLHMGQFNAHTLNIPKSTIFTIALLGSSVTLYIAEKYMDAQKNRLFITWLIITIALGPCT